MTANHPKRKPDKASVVIYTHDQCSFCRQLKEFLQRQGIAYQERNIGRSKSAAKEYERLGLRGVPVLQMGKTLISGFQPDRLKKALRLRNEKRAP